MKKLIGFIIGGVIAVAAFFGFTRWFSKDEYNPPETPNASFDGNVWEDGEFEDETFTPLSAELTLNESLSTAQGVVRYELDGAYTLETVAGDKTELGGADTEEIVLKGGENGATITAIGSGENIKSAIQPTENAVLTFQNITFQDETGGGVNWTTWALEFGGNLVFENCKFPDQILLKNDANVKFINCSFHSGISGRYSVWVWDGSASFEECTFTGYRGLKIHEEEGSDVVSVIVNECLFDTLSEKPGVTIGRIEVQPEETFVYVMNSRFINCYSWDSIGSLEGVDGFYETDTFTSEFNFIKANNFVECPEYVYKITYKAVQEGELTEIYEDLFKADGNYPTEYKSVLGATVDELEEIAWVGAYEDRMFEGWYLDEACTQAFDGTIDPRTKGDVTLYAKISVGYWTPLE